MRAWWLIVAALALSQAEDARAQDAAPAGEPSAGDKDTARRLMDEGDGHYEAKRYEDALRAYRAADDIMGVPTTGYEVGKANEALGRFVEARDAYLKAMRYPQQPDESSAYSDARSHCEERARALSAKIATLTVSIQGVDDDVEVELFIDKKPVKAGARAVPRSVNPGEHTIEARAAGHKPASTVVKLADGQKREVELELERIPGAPVPRQEHPREPDVDKGGHFPIAAMLGFGFGAAGLVVGGVTGGLSLAKASDLDDACDDNNMCPPEQQDTLDDAELLANISNVGFAVGGAGILFGIIAILTFDSPKSNEHARIFEPVGNGLRVRF